MVNGEKIRELLFIAFKACELDCSDWDDEPLRELADLAATIVEQQLERH